MIVSWKDLPFSVSYFCLTFQYFLKEEQNFISANEIDNMVLIMPTSTTRRSATVTDGAAQGGSGKVRASRSPWVSNKNW